MKLRFDVDQAACARAGVGDCEPTAVIEVNAAQIKVEVRNLIADRLIGNDVCQLWNSEKGTSKSVDARGNPVRLVADAPTFEALMKAVLKDAQIVQARQSCHRAIALARANTLEESRPVELTPGQILIAPAVLPTSVTAQSAAAPAVASAKKRTRKKRVPTRAPKAPRASKRR
jgi:hypothetical protein